MDTAGVLVKSRGLGVADLAVDNGQMVGARSVTPYPKIVTPIQNGTKTQRTNDASNIGNVYQLITQYGMTIIRTIIFIICVLYKKL